MSIGAFAAAVGVPTSALRYYDEVGVLPPAHVDPVTGYRFYDAAQVRRARLVGVLRGLGLSVGEMRYLLKANDSVAAERLRLLAAQRTADAQQGAGLLVMLAAALAAEESVASVLVDAAHLRVVLGRVARVAGEAPLDALQLVLGDGFVVLGSDRYRLARWSLRVSGPTVGDATGIVPLADLDGLFRWLDGQVTVTCRVLDGRVSWSGSGVDFVCQPHPAGFPDLATIYAARVPAGRHRRILARNEVAGLGEVLVLDVDGNRVELSRSLVEGTVTSLAGGEVLLLVDEPESAVLFRFPGQPDHDVLVMPRTGDGPGGTAAGGR